MLIVTFGVGFDQLLMVEPPTDPDMDFRYRIFNADGSEVEQCGNGARCFAKFVYDKKLIGREIINVQTAAGNIELRIQDDGDVTVDMGIPRLEPRQIPFKASNTYQTYDLDVDGDKFSIGAVSMGNPHAVMQVDDINRAPVERLGPKIEGHHRFPKRCNAGFMQVLDSGRNQSQGLRAWRGRNPRLRFWRLCCCSGRSYSGFAGRKGSGEPDGGHPAHRVGR